MEYVASLSDIHGRAFTVGRIRKENHAIFLTPDNDMASGIYLLRIISNTTGKTFVKRVFFIR